MNNQPRKKRVYNKNSDSYRPYRFGIPVDISGLENLGTDKGYNNTATFWFDKHSLTRFIYAGMYQKSIENGNPETDMIKQEEDDLLEKIELAIGNWLPEAMKRLPPNQEICIHLRFNLDKQSINRAVRTTQEVGDIVGISQRTAHRNIERGLKNLRKDFKQNLEPAIKKLKS